MVSKLRTDISRSAIRRWVRVYRQRGVEGLEIKRRAGGNTRVTPEVRQRMVAVKKAHPEYGPRRIADVLKRFFLIPTSQSTVHKTLSAKGLVNKAKRSALDAIQKVHELLKQGYTDVVDADLSKYLTRYRIRR